MSQQGAPHDWWHKLYDDPPAGPDTAAAPDPSDTLDSRFSSAASVTGAAPAAAAPAP
ncbi:hypothetical protein GPJ59_36645, partial [Streptomyces bambusae]|nr:hypothetical protein [Streptomyces bambusae]